MSPGFELTLETRPLPSPGGAVKRRLAVRALVVRGDLGLMVHSRSVGDWKFPGGGVEARETPEQALAREIAEETGYQSRGPFRLVGRAIERAEGREVPGSLFEMESRYYHAAVIGEPGDQNLDDYERHLGFEARWISWADALAANRQLAASGRADLPPWLSRETQVLAWMVENRPF